MAQFPSTTSASDVWNVTDIYRAVAGGNWPSGAIPDPYFPYVTMLLPGNGTNGAQNNTFLDSSTNNYTITRNGNTTQGTFSPYGSNWSNFFDGSGDYLSLPSNSAFTLGTGDFTIEMWYNPSVSYASGNVYLCDMGSNGTRIQLYLNSIYFIPQSGNNIQSAAGVGMVVGTWYHVAAVRSGSTMTLYVNGASVGSTTNSNNLTDTLFRIGDYGGGGYGFNGYISNVRVVKGTAIYTSAFTPSTTPLTAVSGTSLLTCQSNRFIDNSTNNFTITVNGNPSIQRFSPFSPTASYSTSVIGGSGYFDGSGDYLSSSCGSVGTGNFTIEGWFYFNATPSTMGLFQASSTSGGFAPNQSANLAVATGSSSTWQIYAKNTFTTSSSTSVPVRAWGHMALVRNGTTTVLYINGAVVITLTSDSTNYSTSFIGLGGIYDNSSYLLNGYLSNFRVVVGTAVYTAAFTPPTAQLTAISGTSLLTNFTNGAIFDNAMMNNLETVGNAQISTSVSKFGGGSMAFDGSGDYLFEPATQLLAWGTGNFTIEMWINTSTTSVSGGASRTMWGTSSASYQGQLYLEVSTGKVVFGNTGSTFIKGTSNVADGNWNHIAISRSGTTCRLFVNGTQEASGSNSVNYDAQPTFIGAFGASDGFFNGYIDDLRITKGFARYTANFTAPTAAFPTL